MQRKYELIAKTFLKILWGKHSPRHSLKYFEAIVIRLIWYGCKTTEINETEYKVQKHTCK